LIDTHCHLTDPRLAGQLPDVLERARAAGVHRMVTIGTSPEEWDSALELCRANSHIRCAIGVHPNNAAEVGEGWEKTLAEKIGEPVVAAVGEMGLDYHYDHSPRELQREFFQRQLTIAVGVNLPVIIHSRESVDDCLAVMKDFPVCAAVFHCFTGTMAEAEKILAAGYWLGFTGVVTFKKTEELRQIAKMTPADRLMVETDSPYLSPEPKRGQKINEPALVMYVAAAVAAARGMSVQELDRLTTANAGRFFRWA